MGCFSSLSLAAMIFWITLKDLGLRHVLDHAQDQHDVVAQELHVLFAERRDDVVHDLSAAPCEREVALVLGRLQHVGRLLEGAVGQGAARLRQVHQALELIQHLVEVAPVAQQALDQTEQITEVDVLLDLLQLLGHELEGIVRDRHHVVHELLALRLPAGGAPGPARSVLDLGGEQIELLV